MKTANKKQEKGLYISLRMDGRVRGSGVGSPPWDRLAVSLPPVSGSLICFTIMLILGETWSHVPRSPQLTMLLLAPIPQPLYIPIHAAVYRAIYSLSFFLFPKNM